MPNKYLGYAQKAIRAQGQLTHDVIGSLQKGTGTADLWASIKKAWQWQGNLSENLFSTVKETLGFSRTATGLTQDAMNKTNAATLQGLKELNADLGSQAMADRWLRELKKEGSGWGVR